MSVSSAWDPTDVRIESKYAQSLVQLDPAGKRIPHDPKEWKCEASGETSNLWLNLSTGYIGGGRKNWDGVILFFFSLIGLTFIFFILGTGGSGAALAHYEATGRQYPLCVKLGTITANTAEVWSYAVDEDCLGP